MINKNSIFSIVARINIFANFINITLALVTFASMELLFTDIATPHRHDTSDSI